MTVVPASEIYKKKELSVFHCNGSEERCSSAWVYCLAIFVIYSTYFLDIVAHLRKELNRMAQNLSNNNWEINNKSWFICYLILGPSMRWQSMEFPFELHLAHENDIEFNKMITGFANINCRYRPTESLDSDSYGHHDQRCWTYSGSIQSVVICVAFITAYIADISNKCFWLARALWFWHNNQRAIHIHFRMIIRPTNAHNRTIWARTAATKSKNHFKMSVTSLSLGEFNVRGYYLAFTTLAHTYNSHNQW